MSGFNFSDLIHKQIGSTPGGTGKLVQFRRNSAINFVFEGRNFDSSPSTGLKEDLVPYTDLYQTNPKPMPREIQLTGGAVFEASAMRVNGITYNRPRIHIFSQNPTTISFFEDIITVTVAITPKLFY
jgi:hypothetical protein